MKAVASRAVRVLLGTTQLGRLWDVPVIMDWSLKVYFWVMIVLVGAGWWEASTLPVLAVAYTSVLLHEFGHILTARRFGVSTRQVSMFVFGGIAQLESRVEDPKKMFLVSVAGPLVNVGLAGLFFAIGFVFTIFEMEALNKACMLIVLINSVLAVFNMLPLYPTDGGQVVMSLFRMAGMDRFKAVIVACWISLFGAVLLGVFAIVQGALMISLVAVFIILASRQELKNTRAARDLQVTS